MRLGASIVTLVILATVLTSATARGVSFVTAYDADVNRSGHVNVADLQQVAARVGQLVVTPTALPMLKETHVVITEARLGLNFASGNLENYRPILVPIDRNQYPAGASFRLWAVMHSDGGDSICVELVDVSDPGTEVAIPGARACSLPGLGDNGSFSGSFDLPHEELVLSIRPVLPVALNGTLASARVVVSTD